MGDLICTRMVESVGYLCRVMGFLAVRLYRGII